MFLLLIPPGCMTTKQSRDITYDKLFFNKYLAKISKSPAIKYDLS